MGRRHAYTASAKESSSRERASHSPAETDLLTRLGKHQSFLDKLPKDNSFPGAPWHVESGGSSQSGDAPPLPAPLVEGDSTPVKDEGGGSTPVLDENEETANNAANPIEFLTQIINQSQKSSNSSSFFENLSQLTKKMSNQLNTKTEDGLAGMGVSVAAANENNLSEWKNGPGHTPTPPSGPPPVPPPTGPSLPGRSKPEPVPPPVQHPPRMPPQLSGPPPMPPDFSKPPPMMNPGMPVSQPPRQPAFPPNFNPSVPPPMPPPPQNLGGPTRLQVPPSPGTPSPDQGKWPPGPGMVPPVTPPGPHYKPPVQSPLGESFGQPPVFPPSGHVGFKPPSSSPSVPGGSVIPTLGGNAPKPPPPFPPTTYGGNTPTSSHDKALEKEQLEFIEKLKRKSSTSGPSTPTVTTSPQSLLTAGSNLRTLTEAVKEDGDEGTQSSTSSREGKHPPDGESGASSDPAKPSPMDMSESSDDDEEGKPISSVVVVKSGSSVGDKDVGKKGEYARDWRGDDGNYSHRRESTEHVSERREAGERRESGERRLSGGDRHETYDHRRGHERRETRDTRDPYYDQYRREYYQQDRYGYDRQRDYHREAYSARAYPKRPPPPPPPPPYDRGGGYYPRY